MNQFESTELATPSHTQTAGEHNEAPERENALPDLDEEVVGKWKSFLPADKFEELVRQYELIILRTDSWRRREIVGR